MVLCCANQKREKLYIYIYIYTWLKHQHCQRLDVYHKPLHRVNVADFSHRRRNASYQRRESNMSLSREMVPVDKKSSAYRSVLAMSKKDSSINAEDPMQLELYRSLRSSYERVTIKEFKRWLESREDESMSTAFHITVWCVPQEKLPQWSPYRYR